MKCVVISPPWFRPTQLPLALPCLCTYLNSIGKTASFRDLNILWWETLLNYQTWTDVRDNAIITYKRLKKLKHPGSNVIKKILCLKAALLTDIDKLHHKLLEHFNTMHDQDDFYDVEKYMCFWSIIEDILRWFSYIYYPSVLSSHYYKTMFDEDDFEALTHYLGEAHDSNPFLMFYEKAVHTDKIISNAEVVAISIMSHVQMIPGIVLAHVLKSHYPSKHITLGGAFISRIYASMVKSEELFNSFDSIIRYDGEHSLEELINALEGRQDISNVPNAIYRCDRGIVQNPVSMPKQLRDIPFPNYSDANLSHYWSPSYVFPIQISRGCYWAKCKFCDIAYGRNMYQCRTSHEVIRYLEELIEHYEARYFHFVDESIPPSRIYKIAEWAAKNDLRIHWSASARLEKYLTSQTLKMLRKGGCAELNFGLETGSQRLSNAMIKGINIGDASRILKNCAELGIATTISLFFGFPGETMEDINDTFAFIQAHKHELFGIVFGMLSVNRHSEIGLSPERFGVIISEGMNSWKVKEFQLKTGISDKRYRQIYEAFHKVITDIPHSHSQFKHAKKGQAIDSFPVLSGLFSIDHRLLILAKQGRLSVKRRLLQFSTKDMVKQDTVYLNPTCLVVKDREMITSLIGDNSWKGRRQNKVALFLADQRRILIVPAEIPQILNMFEKPSSRRQITQLISGQEECSKQRGDKCNAMDSVLDYLVRNKVLIRPAKEM